MQSKLTHSLSFLARHCGLAILTLGLGLLLALGQGRAQSGPPAAPLPALQGAAATEHLRQQGLYEALAKAVTTSRYQVKPVTAQATGQTGAQFAAGNPRQQYQTFFTPGGVRVAAQTGTEAEGEASLSLKSVGYGNQQLPVTPAALTTNGARIEYARRLQRPDQQSPATDHQLTEWYINRPDGLEQGFTLAAPPMERVADAPLALELSVGGEMRAEASSDGQQVWFVRGDGERVLGYNKLVAFDATGERLATRMRVAEGALRLEVDDRDATYPVVIDPLIYAEKKLTASDAAAFDEFGYSVAISGDTVVVGAHFDDTSAGNNAGSAYVYVRSGNTWSEQARLFASNGATDDEFGYSVAISGDTIVVGAPETDRAHPFLDIGSAYVYVRNNGSWSEQARLTIEETTFNDRFGYSVAISGETLVVGAPFDDTSVQAAGTLYIYVRNNGTWSRQGRIFASGAEAHDHFGMSVAIGGETIVAAAVHDDTNGGTDAGSVYVYVRNGTTWSEQTHLFASDGATGDLFGDSVAISGGTIVIGAVADDTAAGAGAGSAYVFVRNGTVWNEQAHLFASAAAAQDAFGNSVAISGETIVVGAYRAETAPGRSFDGVAYVYVRDGTTWNEEAQVVASDAANEDQFGNAVAISDQTIVVGAYQANAPGKLNTGSAYIFSPDLYRAFAANGGSGSFKVFASPGVNWTATSNNPSWLTILSGNGTGTATFSVAAHSSATPRAGTITINNEAPFTVYQGAQFNDVPANHIFATEIGKLSALGITAGCGGGNFCPESNVTREQMAIFIERSLGVTNPPEPATPTFLDVPNSGATDFSYGFIEDFVARGITAGCQGPPNRLFCPFSNVTREQMAIFILRALEGSSYGPPEPPTPTFADVPNSGATDFSYGFIEQMFARGITTGCQGPPVRLYCPSSPVTRGQMAVFLVRAFAL